MRKKILIVGQHFWPESFRVNDIADFLANEKGCTVDVLCGIPNYPSGSFSEGYGYFKNRKQTHKNIKIRRVFEVPRGNNSNIRIFLNYISFPLASLFHLPYLLTKKYDKIFIYQLSPVMMAAAGILLGKMKRIETTMYVLDLWPENLYSVLDIKSSFLRKIAASVSNWHYRSVDKLVVLSAAMKARLMNVASITENQIIVIPQSAEKLYEESIEDESLVKRFKDTFNIVFTGNISPAQSFPTMIEAAKILKERRLSDIRWVIVGDGMFKSEAEAMVVAENLSELFIFEGQKPVDEIPKYTHIADCLVGCLVKSDLLEATIPAKVMSYLASGKPLVLAMDGEVQTLINDRIKGGFAGPAGDSMALADNIEKLYHLPESEREGIQNRLKTYHCQNLERNLLLTKLYNFIFNT